MTVHMASVLGDGVELQAAGEKNVEGPVALPSATEKGPPLVKGQSLS